MTGEICGDKDRFEDLDSVTRRGGDNLLGT
jgi:hypothetical protein